MRRGTNKIPRYFSCPGDCKELSKKTKRSTYDSNQARTKPWPTQPPTSDNNSPITKWIRTNKTQKCFSNLGDCSRLSKEARRWNSRNQGSSQLTVWLVSFPDPLMPACHRLQYARTANKGLAKCLHIPCTTSGMLDKVFAVN